MTTLYPFITRLEVDVNGFCTQRNNKQVRASHRFGSPSFNFNFLVLAAFARFAASSRSRGRTYFSRCDRLGWLRDPGRPTLSSDK